MIVGWLSSLFGPHEVAQPSMNRKSGAWTRSTLQDDDHAMRGERDTLRLEARDMDRNNGTLFGGLNRICRYALPNIRVAFKTTDADWNKKAETVIKRWALVCDVRRLERFSGIIRSLLRETILHGDCGVVLLSDGRIQAVESERIRTPAGMQDKICDGVECDEFGAPVAFWVAPRNSRGYPDAEKCRRILARDFVFARFAPRIDQVRGTSLVAASLKNIIDHDEVASGYVQKVKGDARQGVAITSGSGTVSNLSDGPRYGPQPGESSDERASRPPTYSMDGLSVYALAPGEAIQNITPSTPSQGIVPYEEHLLRCIASGLDIPYEFLQMDFRNLSWSTMNGVVKVGCDKFRELNGWAAERLIRPILDWRIGMAIARGELRPAPLDDGVSMAFNYDLSVPEYLWANEGEHYDASAKGWKIGAKSLDDIARERGETGKELLERKANDIIEAIRQRDRIREQTGVNIQLADLINTNSPGEQSLRETAPSTDPAEEEE